MKDWAIKDKLVKSFLIVAAATGWVGIIAMFGLWRLDTADTQMYEEYVTAISAMAETETAYQEEQKELKNLVIAAGDDAEVTKIISRLNEIWAIVEAGMSAYEATITVPEREAPFYAAKEEYQGAYRTERNKVISLAGQGADPGTLNDAISEMEDNIETVSRGLADTAKNNAQWAAEMAAANTRLFIIVSAILIFGVVVAVLIALRIGRYLTGLIASPMVLLSDAAKKLSRGDVDITLAIDSKDEIGELAEAFRIMVGSIKEQAELLDVISKGNYTVSIPVRSEADLMNKSINIVVENSRVMLEEIRGTARQVAQGAEQLSDASQSLASGSTEQASTISDISESIVTIQDMSEKNAGAAEETLGEVKETQSLMEECMDAMKEMIAAINDIDNKSRSITEAVKVIGDIVSQTNILSVNTAIEAARAGEHGKGFAIVANEVRDLAGKSAEAAGEIGKLIESSAKSVEKGHEIVEKVNLSLKEVGDISAKNLERVEQLYDGSKQQSRSISGVADAMGELSVVVETNAAAAEETAASSEEMSAQSSVLDEIVSRFKL